MEENAVGIPEPRSHVEIRENSKQDPQIIVKAYVEDTQEQLMETARVAYRVYTTLRHQMNKGIPTKNAMAAMGLTTDPLTDPDPEE